METLYLCDPEKNVNCRKTNCYKRTGEKLACRKTAHPEFAKLDLAGKPIVAQEHEFKKPHWIVRQTGFNENEMTCSECGFSFYAKKIIARKSCERCGAVISERDTVYVVRGGKLVKDSMEDFSKNNAQSHHEQIPDYLAPRRFSFIGKIIKIIFPGGGKRN